MNVNYWQAPLPVSFYKGSSSSIEVKRDEEWKERAVGGENACINFIGISIPSHTTYLKLLLSHAKVPECKYTLYGKGLLAD